MLAAVAAMPLDHAPGSGQRLPLPDPALGLRRARPPPRRPVLPGLPARRDHRAARPDRHLRRAAERRSSTGSPSSTRRTAPTSGDWTGLRQMSRIAAAPDGRPRRQRRLDRARHGPLLRRDRGGRRARRSRASCSRRPSSGCSESRSTARSTRPSTCRCAAGSGSSSADWPIRAATGPARRARSRTFWHGGFGSSVCWGDPDLGLAMAFLTNGVRRDEAGAIARRDLSDAVRAAGRVSVQTVPVADCWKQIPARSHPLVRCGDPLARAPHPPFLPGSHSKGMAPTNRDYQCRGSFRLKIVDLKCAVIGENPVVRIVTDEGIDGYGEVESYKPYLTWHVLHLKPALHRRRPDQRRAGDAQDSPARRLQTVG